MTTVSQVIFKKYPLIIRAICHSDGWQWTVIIPKGLVNNSQELLLKLMSSRRCWLNSSVEESALWGVWVEAGGRNSYDIECRRILDPVCGSLFHTHSFFFFLQLMHVLVSHIDLREVLGQLFFWRNHEFFYSSLLTYGDSCLCLTSSWLVRQYFNSLTI